MSASTIVDLGSTWLPFVSIAPAVGVDSTPASGAIIGMIADMRDANNMTSVVVQAGPSISGAFKVQIQTSDETTSGSFTDPTSGLSVMPTHFLSGGLLVLNSGNIGASGLIAAASFLRPHRYVRANIIDDNSEHNAPVSVALVGQGKRTGSGAGTTFLPASGVVGGF